MRASQLWNWIYVNGVTDFGAMSNIAKGLRADWRQAFSIGRPQIVSEQVSNDGTRKWLFRFTDPNHPNMPPVEVETVYIPESDRGTLVRVLPGRVYADLLVLPHGHAKAGAQSHGRGNPGQVMMARERLGRFSRRRAAHRRTCALGREPGHHQYRDDGDGRAAL